MLCFLVSLWEGAFNPETTGVIYYLLNINLGLSKKVAKI
jgi:hypothetical protein